MPIHSAARRHVDRTSELVRSRAPGVLGWLGIVRAGLLLDRLPLNRFARMRPWWARWRDTVLRHLPDALLVVGIAINAWILVDHSEGVWFWADDWDFLFMRGTIPEYDIGWFAPHNNHWLTAHIAVYRMVFDLFGMDSYTPYAATEVAFHALTAILVRILLGRVGAGRWVSIFTALTVTFFGLGANAEIYLASLNHVGALACGLLAAIIVSGTTFYRRAQALTGLVLVVGQMFGLTGLATLLLVALFIVLRHGLRAAFLPVAAPAVAFVLWWLTYGRETGANSIRPTFDLTHNLPDIPARVWTGITGTLGDGSGLASAGPVLAGLLLLALLAPGRPAPDPLVRLAWASAIATLAQLLMVGIARFDYGADQIGMSHYAYINLVLLTPVIALFGRRLADWVAVPRHVLLGVTAVVFVAYAFHGVTSVRKWQNDFRMVSASSDDLAFAIKHALENGQQVLRDGANPADLSNLVIPRYISAPRIMSALGDHEPSPDALLAAETYYFTTADDEDHGLSRPPVDLRAVNDFERLDDASGCQRVSTTGPYPVIRLTTGTGGNEIVVWSDSTTVTVRLERDGAVGPNHDITVEPGAVHLATTAPDAELYAGFNGTGTFTICQA